MCWTDIAQNAAEFLKFIPGEPMLFSSGTFWALFLVFIPIYALVRGRRWQMLVFVSLFSLYFYYKSSGWFMVLLIGTSIVDWCLSRLLVQLRPRAARRWCVAASLMTSLGILGYFKYANFFLWNINALVGGNFQPLELILPVGISFYTFQSVSYIIDVYKGRVRPTRYWLEYFFFLSFFPALVAGPIVRADYFLPQLDRRNHATRRQMWTGMWLILLGVVKKAIIADYIAQYNDLIFQSPTGYSGFESLMGIIGYTMQIYCDFSGYSDMAIGIALLMGYRFKQNFNAPFKSQNPSEFWRRWHISLSTWLRDYLYIPLGGNRRGKTRTYLNNFITMVLGGIWHGAGWMYLMWGAYQGGLLAAHKAIKSTWRTPEWLKDTLPAKAFNVSVTFILTVIGFTIFRASSPQTLAEIGGQIFGDFHAAVAPQFVQAYMMIVLAMFAGLVMHFAPTRWTGSFARTYTAMPLAAQGLLLAAVIFFVIQARSSDLVPFIYLQY